MLLPIFSLQEQKGDKTFVTYECGIEPFGSAWVRYSSHYYIYALIFIAFDVDILYLFPAALSYTRVKSYEFWSLLVFMLILPCYSVRLGKGVFCLETQSAIIKFALLDKVSSIWHEQTPVACRLLGLACCAIENDVYVHGPLGYCALRSRSLPAQPTASRPDAGYRNSNQENGAICGYSLRTDAFTKVGDCDR